MNPTNGIGRTERRWLTGIVVLLLAATGSLGAANLINNPGFEDWLLGFGVNLPLPWLTSELLYPGSADTTTVYVHSGRYAVQLVGGDTVAFASTVVNLGGVKDFYFSGWARSPQFLAGTFTLSWLNSTLATTGEPVVMPVVVAPDYAQFYCECTAPESAAYGLVTVLALAGETLYADDIDLEPSGTVGETVVNPPGAVTAVPNPASVRSGVECALTSGRPARWEIFDTGGRPVRRFDRARVAVRWDGRDSAGNRVSPGVYFVRAVSRTLRVTKKIVLLP